MTTLHLDWETRSTVDLRETGVYPYAADPNTDIWLGAWAIDEEKPELWMPGMPVPAKIIEHVNAGGEIVAHNAQFERIIWREIAGPRYGWPDARMEQFHCTAAEAAAMSLPRSLGQLAQVLGLAQQKDDEGARLMLRMTRPRKVAEDGTITWWDVPERVERLGQYCVQDVEVERAVMKCLRRLTPREREVYLLDQRINDRGIQIDRPLIVAAQGIVDRAVGEANNAIRNITDGSVQKVTNNGSLRTWLAEQGVDTLSVGKARVAELLDDPALKENVREALQLRADAGRSSVAKLTTMLNAACSDDRIRGTLLYHGAGTGRWTGRLVQTQNFPRGEVKDIEEYIPLVLTGDFDALNIFHPPMKVVSSMLRSVLVASPGHDLIAADYSAIEARVLNWLAGQEDVLDLFRAGEDVYKHNAAKLYGIPLAEVQKFPHRQTGKFQELGCGFQMGWQKAVRAAHDVYGLDLEDDFAKEVVNGYRATHPMVVNFWYEANDAVIQAVSAPGRPVHFGANRRLTAIKAGAYLYIILPSKRPLCYAAPTVVDAPTPWGELKPAVEFSGVDSFSRQWGRMRLYGGLIVENIVQGTSRDLLAEGMLRVEAAGYPVVMSVHDEAVSEVPLGFGSVEEYESLLSALPDWADGCPVTAEGWRASRYRK